MIPFVINIWITRKAPLVGVDDPWGYGRSSGMGNLMSTTSPQLPFNATYLI
jgi:hypothetical protein